MRSINHNQFIADYGPFGRAMLEHLECREYEDLSDCTTTFMLSGFPADFVTWYSMTDYKDPTRNFYMGSMYFGSIGIHRYVVVFDDDDNVKVWKKNA